MRATTELSPAQRILAATADAVRAAQTISFRATTTSTVAMLAGAFPDTRADVHLLRAQGGSGVWLARVTGESSVKDKGQVGIDVAWTDRSVELVDHDKKEVREAASRGAQGPGMSIAQLVKFKEVFGADPFGAEVNAGGRDTFEFVMEPSETLDGEACDVMLVTRNGRNKVRWAIAQSDHFPRRMQQIHENSMMAGTITVDLTQVRISPTPVGSPADLRVAVPDGYKELRASAPAVDPVLVTNPTLRKPGTDAPAPKPAETPGETGTPAGVAGDGGAARTEEASATQGGSSAIPAAPAAPTTDTFPREAPACELATMSGEKVKLADMKGKVVVIQFFGSWCLTCAAWHEHLIAELSALKAQGVEVWAVSCRERDNANAAAELAKGTFGFTHLVGGESVSGAFGAKVYPATYVVNKEGTLTRAWQGETSEDAAKAVAAEVRAALGK